MKETTARKEIDQPVMEGNKNHHVSCCAPNRTHSDPSCHRSEQPQGSRSHGGQERSLQPSRTCKGGATIYHRRRRDLRGRNCDGGDGERASQTQRRVHHSDPLGSSMVCWLHLLLSPNPIPAYNKRPSTVAPCSQSTLVGSPSLVSRPSSDSLPEACNAGSEHDT